MSSNSPSTQPTIDDNFTIRKRLIWHTKIWAKQQKKSLSLKMIYHKKVNFIYITLFAAQVVQQ